MNTYLQSELKQMQNRNKFFNEILLESKTYLNTITESQIELLCLYPNKIIEYNQSIHAFRWILEKSSKYYELFPIEKIDFKSMFTSFICLRNKWIKYNLAEWIDNSITHYNIPDRTISFFSIYNTEQEIIKNCYMIESYFDYTIEYTQNIAKEIKDPNLYSEWHTLYSNSQVYSYLITNYDINR